MRNLIVGIVAALSLVGALATEPLSINAPSKSQSCPAQTAAGESCNCIYWWCPWCAA